MIYLGLGSNLGDRGHNLGQARYLLEEAKIKILRASSVIETEPWGVIDQPKFLNQILEIDWAGSARNLLLTTQRVEATVGRTASYRWGPREIDIDLLLFDQLLISEPGLEVPHPRLWQREFVVRPLTELRPDLN
ncbi:MAG: 2-amino-4-hydroxy-6-hydroxymethyldihydropteridine diphosphokinase, partial [Candidatus Dormibacteraceae bacterium]